MPATVKKSCSAARIKLTKKVPVSIAEIEKSFGFDKIEPVVLPSSESEIDFDRDKEYFRDMYEDELKEFYKRI